MLTGLLILAIPAAFVVGWKKGDDIWNGLKAKLKAYFGSAS